MDARKSGSNRKRQQENVNRPCPQRKSQRLLDKSQPSSMKITDLDDDCLEKIFKHLSLRSLFNVAVANEWLRPAANIVYKRKFGMKQVFIDNGRYTSASGLVLYGQTTFIGLKACLQFLRCLGSSINHLNIWYSRWNKKQCEHIHQYVNEYCANSLVNIEFWDKPNRNPIKQFGKPFVNIHTAMVYNSCLGDQFSSFQQWFPNMRTLKLHNVRTLRCIGTPFEHLKDLRININKDGALGHTMVKAIRLLRLHPQLHSLEIRMGSAENIALNMLLDFINANPEIRTLKIIYNYVYWYFTANNTSDIQRLAREHPSLVEIELTGLILSPNDAAMLAG